MASRLPKEYHTRTARHVCTYNYTILLLRVGLLASYVFPYSTGYIIKYYDVWRRDVKDREMG